MGKLNLIFNRLYFDHNSSNFSRRILFRINPYTLKSSADQMSRYFSHRISIQIFTNKPIQIKTKKG